MLVQLIATLIYIAMFNSAKLASMQYNQVNFAIHQICVTWVADAGLTQVKQQVVNAWNTSLFLLDPVRTIIFFNLIIAIYANSPQDLLMCTDGFGALDIPIPGVVDVRNFHKGLYRCGKPIKSDKAG